MIRKVLPCPKAYGLCLWLCFAVCELFAQARLMTIEEIEARFEVAKRAIKNRSAERINRELAVMLKLVQHRVEAWISSIHVCAVDVDDLDELASNQDERL